MAVDIKEIVTLVQQLKTHLDNSDDAIWSLRVSDGGAFIQMRKKDFLSKFVDFEIEVNEQADFYPYKLVSCIAGVSFFSLLDASAIVDLKDAMPDQWEYIQNEIQKEAA